MATPNDLPRWAKPQRYMKNPVATNVGWEDSVTGEVLQGHRGLKDKIDLLSPASASKKSSAPVAKEETPKKKTAKTKLED